MLSTCFFAGVAFGYLQECNKLNTVRAGCIMAILFGAVAMIIAGKNAFGQIGEGMRNGFYALASTLHRASFHQVERPAWPLAVARHRNMKPTRVLCM